MNQVIHFDKSLQMRLQEYNDVLSGYDVLPASALEKEWSFYLDLALDPLGWQAIWKIHRNTCEDLGIPFPSVVLVVVLSLDLPHLNAIVRILAVQDDIHIADRHYVPLKQLFPTKEQDKSLALNLQNTANALDMLRFFYNHLFLPWDLEEDDSTDWRTKHLESRLRLYYDVKNGVIPRPTSEHLHSLLSEARRLQAKRERLEMEMDDVDVDDDNASLNELMELHIRLMEIKGEVDVIENPVLRKVHIRRLMEVNHVPKGNSKNVWLIFDEGNVDEHMQFLQRVKQDYPSEKVKFAPNLWLTLENAVSEDVFILHHSMTHEIKATGALEDGGILKGICEEARAVVTTTRDDTMFDFRGKNTLLQNLTIDAHAAQVAIVVREHCHLTLKNCKLIGDGKSSIHQGILVLPGASVEILNCEMSNFSTAIVGNTGANIVIKSTEIHDVCFGMKVYDNCSVKIKQSLIKKCKDYGVCVETEKSLDGEENMVGGFETLNIIPLMQLDSIMGGENVKGDAIINIKQKLEPFEDLFENQDLDLTVRENMELCVEEQEGITI